MPLSSGDIVLEVMPDTDIELEVSGDKVVGTIGYVVTDGDLEVTLDGSSDAVGYSVTNGNLGVFV